MSDMEIPTLEVGFAIDTGGSFASLERLQQVMDSTEGRVLADASRIEKATSSMVNLGGATTQITTFGNAATRELQSVARAKAQSEKAGEALIRQLEREASTIGKTKAEVRDLKIEQQALAAVGFNNTEQADRLLAAARKRTAAAEAAAEAVANESRQAELAADREAKAIREAAFAYQMFEARVRQGSLAMREQAAMAAAAAAEREATAVREAAFAYQMFEARVRQGAQAMKEQAAADAAAAVSRADLATRAQRLVNAIDPAAAAQSRFNREMGEARTLIGAGAISLDQYANKLRIERELLAGSADAHARISAAAVNTRMAMQGASYQVQDFFTQVSMGANPVNAFAVQGAQLAGQFSNVEGRAGDVARFFMGPWGLAITAGAMLLGPFIGQLLKSGNGADDLAGSLKKAVDGLKKTAAEADVSRQAQARFSMSLAGVQAALREQREALDQQATASRTAAEQANIHARAERDKAFAIREGTLAALEAVRAQLAADQADTKSPDMNRAFRIEQAQKMLPDLERRIAAARATLQSAERQYQETRVDLATEAAKRAADPVAKINKLYDDQAAAAKRAATIGARAGDEVTAALTRQLTAIEVNRSAALKAEQEKQSAAKETARQIGRSINLTDARDIVEGIGGRVTSDVRSYEKQKALYDKYMAYKAGKGPWAALAAAPGTSDHERGFALDIAKTSGMSLAKIRDAFRAQGVAVKQLLDEGSHFHVSWKKGADDAAAASKRLADVQATLAGRFDPATAAAIEYRDALKSIGEAHLDPATASRYAAAAKVAFQKARAEMFTLPSMDDITAAVASSDAADAAAKAFGENVLQPLRDELALYGKVGPARDLAALGLEKQAFLARNMDQGLDVALARWKSYFDLKRQLIDKDAEASAFSDSIRYQIDLFDELTRNVERAGRGMEESFGRAGGALGNLASQFSGYMADQKRLDALRKEDLAKAEGIGKADQRAAAERRVNALYDAKTITARIGLYGDMTHAAKGFFGENSKGYKALETAEKVFRAVEFALSVRAIAQDAIETGSAIAKSGARAAAHAVEAVAKAIASLPFPANLVAGAATAAALAAIGISVVGGFGGGKGAVEKPNEGRGTVFGDPEAQSQSIKRALDSLKEVDTLMLSSSREMAGYLRSIESQIGGVAAQIVRAGDVDASAGVQQGFKANAIGSILGNVPLVGGLLKSLFGTRTDVTGGGIYGGAQSLDSILNGGFAGQTYADVTKTRKFLGIVTGRSTGTEYGSLDASISNNFTLILRSFNDAIRAAAGPLGASTDEIEQRLNGFIVSIGKIDTKGLTGAQIEERLSAVFGAAADGMAAAAIPGIEKWQKVGEGAFETLVRVASTVETVTSALGQMGSAARALSIDAKLAVADQFDSARDFATAADAYVRAYYTKAEQNAATLERFGQVFVSLGVTMPRSLADFRALVDAQDLMSASGQAAYATLLKLAPAFADLMQSMEGAKSAADVIAERQDLERKLLELNGDTAAIRALDLAKLDASNRALQQQIWAVQDAQEAARAAEDLRKAWTSVGDSIMDEVKRIRGLDGQTGEGGFATLMGRFNAATFAARGGDQDAAKSLPGLSQELLRAAENAARSRQELDRVRAQTAASLEETYAAIAKLSGGSAAQTSTAALLSAMQDATTVVKPGLAADAATDEVRTLRAEVADLKATIASGLAAIAGNTGRVAQRLDDVTAAGGGDAIATVAA